MEHLLQYQDLVAKVENYSFRPFQKPLLELWVEIIPRKCLAASWMGGVGWMEGDDHSVVTRRKQTACSNFTVV